MATQRVGKGSSEEKKNGSVKENVSSGESSIKSKPCSYIPTMTFIFTIHD